jgi:cobalt-zinc-cadmium efflux system protein
VAHHDHAGHGSGPSRVHQRRALVLALVLNGGFLVVEVVGGLVFGSLALLADAGHMLSDVVALGVALVAHGLVARPATARHSFGLQRAEVLAAQANAVLLLAVSGWVVFEALSRIGDPYDVDGAGMLVVGLLGLAANVASMVVLGRAAGESLNLRGALLHMTADAAGSVGVLVAAVAVLVADATWVDPAASLGIAALVAISAWRLLRDTTHVLLEGTPAGVDPDTVTAAIVADADVDAVHHLHLWHLASDTTALSAHVVLRDKDSLHDAQVVGDRLKHLLAERFDVGHATLELECHACEPAPELSRRR